MSVEITPELAKAAQKYDVLRWLRKGFDAVAKVCWGYIDKNEAEVISCKYDDAKPFSGGLATVKAAGKRGYVVKNRNSAFGNK